MLMIKVKINMEDGSEGFTAVIQPETIDEGLNQLKTMFSRDFKQAFEDNKWKAVEIFVGRD